MRILLSLFIAIFVCANAVGQRNEPIMIHSFPVESIQMVEVRASGGNITVTGNADSEVTVEVFATNPILSSSRIKELFEENHTIDIKEENGKLTVVARVRRLNPTTWDRIGNRNRLSISFRINIPNDANSDLRTNNGNISISNLSGKSQVIQTSNGALSVTNISGNLVGRTSNGNISLNNSQGNINLTTSNSGISAQNSSGTITLRTSNGRISLDDLTGVIEARTSNGRITGNDIQGTLETRTSSGSITLNRLSGNVSASNSGGSMSVGMLSVDEFVRLSNSRESISLTVPDNDYNLNVRGDRINTSGLRDFRGNMDLRRQLNGTIGGGGTEINVRGQRVNLTFR